MIPALRAAFDRPSLSSGRRWSTSANRGYLARRLARRRDQREVAAHYTRRAMEAARLVVPGALEYGRSSTRVRDTLQRMEDQYLHTDQATADRLRRT